MNLESIKTVLDSGSGIALKNYLTVKLMELKNIDNLIEKDDVEIQVIEVKAQKRAFAKLKEILQDIMTFSEDVKIKDERDEFGVGIND